MVKAGEDDKSVTLQLIHQRVRKPPQQHAPEVSANRRKRVWTAARDGDRRFKRPDELAAKPGRLPLVPVTRLTTSSRASGRNSTRIRWRAR